MSSEWSKTEFRSPLLERAIPIINQIQGFLKGSIGIANIVVSFLEVLKPIALLQQNSKFSFDSSGVTKAVLDLTTSLTETPIELYVQASFSNYTQHSFTGLMRLMSDSIRYRHEGVIFSHIPGVNSEEAVIRPVQQPDVARLELDTGIGDLSRFTGFALILTADTKEEIEVVGGDLRKLLQQKSPEAGFGSLPQIRSYSYGKLITPITLQMSKMFAPMWGVVKQLNLVENITRGAKGAEARLVNTSNIIRQKISVTEEYVRQIEDIQRILNETLPTDLSFNVLLFENLSIDELLPCWLESDNVPEGRFALGTVGIVQDPRAFATFKTILQA